jgi:hypothetical protein
MDGHSKRNPEWKNKELLYRAVIFLGELSHCDYNFFEEIGKFRFNHVNSRKNCSKNGNF